MSKEQKILNEYQQKDYEHKLNQEYTRKLNKTATKFVKEEQTTLGNDESDKLYLENRRKWHKEYSTATSKYKRYNAETIAPLMARNIKNTLRYYGETTFVMTKKPTVVADMEAVSPLGIAKTKFYEEHGKDFLDFVSGKSNESNTANNLSTDVNLNYQHASFNASQTSASMREGLENIANKNRAVFFDLETLGGKDADGLTRLNQITEFTFKTFDSNGELVEPSFSSIIGSNENQHKEYLNIINKVKNGSGLTNQEEVIFNRLKLMGATGENGTVVDWNEAKDGVINFKQFADEKSVVGNDIDSAMKGANELRNIGKWQEKFSVNYKEKQMYGWEAELFKALDHITDNDITATGHNIHGFDLDMLNRTLVSGLNSTGAKEYAKEKYSEGFYPKHTLDTLSLERTFASDRPLTEKENKILSNNPNLTEHTLEFLVRSNVGEDFYEKAGNAAHTSSIDVEANASLLFKTDRYKQNGSKDSIIPKNTDFGKNIPVTGGNKQLFYAPTGISSKQYGLLGFSQESFFNGYHTQDKYIIYQKDGLVERALFGQYGLNRGVAYSVSSISSFSASDGIKSKIAKIYPELESSQLFSITFKPETLNETSDFKANSLITMVGTKDNIQKAISQLELVATKTAKDTWSASDPYFEDVYDRLGYVTVKDKNIEYTTLSKDPNIFLKQSEDIIKNESAARRLRSLDINRDIKSIDFFDKIDDKVATYLKDKDNVTEEDIKTTRKQVIQEEQNKAHEIATAISEGKEVNLKDYGLIHETIGWKPRNESNYKVYRNTIDAVINSEDYIRQNRNILNTAINFAIQHGSTKEQQDFYYKSIMRAFMDKAIAKSGDEAIGKYIVPFHQNAFNRFEVDISNYKNINSLEPTIFKINLSSSNTLVNNLFKAQGLTKTDIDKLSTAKKVNELEKFQNFLEKTNVITRQEKTDFIIDSQVDNPLTATRKILSRLKQASERNHNAGILSDTAHYSVLDIKKKDFGLASKDIDEVITSVTDNLDEIHFLKHDEDISKHVDKIVDEMLFSRLTDDELRSEDKEISAIVKRTGFSKEKATLLYKTREIQRRDTKDFLHMVLSSVRSAGGNFAYNIHQDALYILNPQDTSMQNMYKVEDLIHNVFSGSIMYTQIGATKTANPLGYYQVGYGDNTRLTFASRIAYAKNSVNWAKLVIQRGADEGNLAGAVQDVFKAFNKSMREISSANTSNAQDMKTMSYFDVNGVLDELPKMMKSGIFNDFKPEYLPDGTEDKNSAYTVFSNLVKSFTEPNGKYYNKPFDKEYLGFNNLYAINTVLPELIKNGTIDRYINIQNSSGGFQGRNANKDIREAVSPNGKNTYKGIYTLWDNDDFGEAQGPSQRHIGDVKARAFKFNADLAKAILLDQEIEDVKIGSVLQSYARTIQSVDAGGPLSYDVDTTFRTRRLASTTSDLRQLYLENKANLEEDIIDSLVMMSDTHENSAVIMPSLADSMLYGRTSLQQIDVRKIIVEHANTDTLTELSRQRKIMPTLSIVDGKIAFNYSNGLFVHEGETLDYIKGYKGAQKAVQAKYTGIMKYGIYTGQNILANEDSINRLLNDTDFGITQKEQDRLKDYLLQAQGVAKERVNIPLAKAHALLQNLLSKYGYNEKIYLAPIEQQANIKLVEGSEKSMNRVLAPAMGSINKKVRTVLENLVGLESTVELGKHGKETDKVIKRYGVQEILHGLPMRSIIDSLTDSTKELANTDFGLIVNGYRNRENLTSQEIESIIKKEFNSVTDFQKAILEERYSLEKAAQKLFKANDLISDKQFIGVLSEPLTGEAKHGELDVTPKQVILGLKEQGKTNEEIVEIMRPAISDIHLSDNGKFIAESPTSFEKLEQIIKDNNLSSTKVIGDKRFDIAPREFVQPQNYDLPRIRSVQDAYGKQTMFTHRNMEIMKNRIYSHDNIDEIEERFKNTFGIEEGSSKFASMYKDIQEGDSIFGELINSLENNRFVVPGEDLLQRFDENKNIASLTKQEQEASQRAYKRLEADGISKEEIDTHIKVAQSKGATGVTESYIRNNYTAQKFLQAMNFNNPQQNLQAGYLVNRGFKKLGIDEIIVDSDVDSSLEKSIYGKNILLDLNLQDVASKHQIIKPTAFDDERYIALPYISPQYMENNDIVKSNYQKELTKLTRYVQDFKTSYANKELSESGIEEHQSRISEQVIKVKNAIAQDLTAKKQILANASKIALSDGGIFTTSGLQLTGRETNESFAKLNFEGLNLVENASKLNAGQKVLDLGFAIASSQSMDRFYNAKYLQDIGRSIGMSDEVLATFKEKLFERLETGGTLSVNSRDPQGYEGSTNANALYFNRKVLGDTLLVSSSLQGPMKNDNDSDKISIGIIKGQADISYTSPRGNARTVTRNIDYATYTALSNMDGVSVKLHSKTKALFEDTIRSIYTDASTMNPMYYDSQPLGHLSEEQSSYTITDSMLKNGESSNRKYTPKEIEEYRTTFAELEQNYLNTQDQQGISSYMDSSILERRSQLSNYIANQDYTPTQIEKFQNSLTYKLDEAKNAERILSDARKTSTGLVNYHAFQTFQMLTRVRQSGAFNGEEMRSFMLMHTALDEAFLSPKNEKGISGLDFVDKFSNAMQNVYNASKSNNKDLIDSTTTELRNVLDELIGARKSKELSKLHIIARDSEGKAIKDASGNLTYLSADESYEQALNTVSSLAKRVDFKNLSVNAERMETSQKGLSYNQTPAYIEGNDNEINQVIQEANMAEQFSYDEDLITRTQSAKPRIDESTYYADRTTPLDESPLHKEVNNRIGASVSKGISHSEKHILPSLERVSILKGAIAGVSAGLLISGYGSTPSNPAETQAMGASEEFNDNYSNMRGSSAGLSDPNLAVNKNTPVSYVINISGDSPQGQDRAIEAINTAVNSQVPMTASINLQMNTSYADKISQLQLNKIVSNSLFS